MGIVSLMEPFGGRTFDVVHDMGDGKRCRQSGKNVNVIGNAPYL